MSEQPPKPTSENIIAFPKDRVSELPMLAGDELALAVKSIHRLDREILGLREELVFLQEALSAPELEAWRPLPEPLRLRVLRKLAGRPQTKTEIRQAAERSAADRQRNFDRRAVEAAIKGGKIDEVEVVGLENELADLVSKRAALEKRVPPDVGEKLLAWRKEQEEGYEKLGRKLTAAKAKVKEAGPLPVPSAFEDVQKQFDWVNADYAQAQFEPIETCKDAEIVQAESLELIHFGKDISTKKVLAELSSRGLRPATFEELLAYAKANPDEQRKHPIVALGSVALVRGDRRVACAWWSYAGRGLGLDRFEDDWRGGCRFLSARK